MIAEKVETRLTYKMASKLGFAFFQGYFFCRPQIIRSRQIPSSKLNLLTILAQVRDPNITMTDLEKIISRDVGISFKLLNYLNSAYYSRGAVIKSIKHALILLGLEQLTRFVSVITLTTLGSDKTDELIRLSSIRGRFCELTSAHCFRETGIMRACCLWPFNMSPGTGPGSMKWPSFLAFPKQVFRKIIWLPFSGPMP